MASIGSCSCQKKLFSVQMRSYGFLVAAAAMVAAALVIAAVDGIF